MGLVRAIASHELSEFLSDVVTRDYHKVYGIAILCGYTFSVVDAPDSIILLLMAFIPQLLGSIVLVRLSEIVFIPEVRGVCHHASPCANPHYLPTLLGRVTEKHGGA